MITFTELKNKSGGLYPAILLDKYIDRKKRKIIRTFLLILTVILLIPVIYFENTKIRGGIFVSLSIWMIFYFLEAMYLYYYFSKNDIDFEVAKLAHSSDEDDLTGSFLNSQMGYFTMLRLGLKSKDINEFLNSNRKKIGDGAIDIFENPNNKFVGIKEYCCAIYNFDKDFSNFLNRYRIDRNIFIGAVSWIDDVEWWSRDKNRFWLKENLSRIKSLGRNWNIIFVSKLFNFGHFSFEDVGFQQISDDFKIYDDVIKNLENDLTSDDSANILLLTPDVSFGKYIVNCFAKFIFAGNAYSNIENKKIFFIDNDKILDFVKKIINPNTNNIEENFDLFKEQKTESEKIIKIFNLIFEEAEKIGDIILVFPDISKTSELCHDFGVNFFDLIKNILKSTNIQCLAISNQEEFYSSLETNFDLIRLFTKISIEDFDSKFAMNILEKKAIILEQKSNLFFTYQSLFSITKIAQNFYSKEQYFDKMLYLLDQISETCIKEKNYFVTEKDVNRIISINNEN
ncbi:MAG TPA: hypothetical protein PKA96_02405 [Candidatus Paceibacterota bacterium]|nr:hypothetical protein [Candidatus Paceibacterota bacterium]